VSEKEEVVSCNKTRRKQNTRSGVLGEMEQHFHRISDDLNQD